MPSLIIEGVISCLLIMPPSVDSFRDFIDCREQYNKVEVVQEWIPLLQTYFKEEDVLQASLMVFCESTGRPRSYNNNTNGTQDIGLFAMNDATWSWLQDKLKFTGDRRNPVLNTRIASWLFYNDGRGKHWYSSEHCWDYDF